MNKKPLSQYNIGIALSGGGIKGVCHAGCLKALEEYKIRPEIISGVSAGSVVGALYADGYSPDQIGQMFNDISFRSMTNISTSRSGGAFSIAPFERFLRRHLRTKSLEDLPIPLHIVATDLDHGHSTIFTHGDLVDCIIASCSVPILFVPKNINGINYVDGGVFKNFPATTIRPLCRNLIGINASPLVVEKYTMSMYNVAQRAYNFMFKANIVADRETCDYLIEPVDMGNYDTFDVEKSREIFTTGYDTTREMLQQKPFTSQE